jgi:hypothetical protein
MLSKLHITCFHLTEKYAANVVAETAGQVGGATPGVAPGIPLFDGLVDERDEPLH